MKLNNDELITQIADSSRRYQAAVISADAEYQMAIDKNIPMLARIAAANLQIFINMLDFCECYRMMVTSGAEGMAARVIARHGLLRAYELKEAFHSWVVSLHAIARETGQLEEKDVLNRQSGQDRIALKSLGNMSKVRNTVAHAKMNPVDLRELISSVDINQLELCFQAVMDRAQQITLYSGRLTCGIRREVLQRKAP